jgi:hypothetical protein
MTQSIRLGLLVILVSPAIAQTTCLDRFVGSSHHSPSDSDCLRELLGRYRKGELPRLFPHKVWRVVLDGQSRFVVFSGKHLNQVPDYSVGAVDLFNARAEKLRSWTFQTGWRIFLKGAAWEHSLTLGADTLVLQLEPVINGRNIRKVYFSLGNDRLRLLRMENDQGKLVQNEYVYPNFEIGIAPEAKSVEEYLALLTSENKGDILSALTFLGGRHIDESHRPSADPPTQSKYAQIFKEVLADPRIQDRIQQLRSSENEWVRQAATLASRGPTERPMY